MNTSADPRTDLKEISIVIGQVGILCDGCAREHMGTNAHTCPAHTARCMRGRTHKHTRAHTLVHITRA